MPFRLHDKVNASARQNCSYDWLNIDRHRLLKRYLLTFFCLLVVYDVQQSILETKSKVVSWASRPNPKWPSIYSNPSKYTGSRSPDSELIYSDSQNHIIDIIFIKIVFYRVSKFCKLLQIHYRSIFSSSLAFNKR